MTGVEILASEQVATSYAFNWTVFWIVGGIALSIITLIGIWQWVTGVCDFAIVPSLFVVGLAAGAIFGSLFGESLSKPVAYTTEHKVIISDEVPMTEFYEHYEVIKQDGKIFTVREK